MSVDLSNSSIVQWFEGTEKHQCGYCKTHGSISNGMWAESLRVEDYQDLIDRGWRRSGKYCYKPIMEETCCPLYTIKCDAINFVMSKSQKKIIKKFNKFLRDGELTSNDNSDTYNCDEPGSCTINTREIPNMNLSNIKSDISDNFETTSSRSGNASTSNISGNCTDRFEVVPKATEDTCDKVKVSSQTISSLKTHFKEGEGADPNKPPCKKAKLLRIERKKEKALKRGLSFEKSPKVQVPKSLEEFLEEAVPNDSKYQLRIRLIPTSIPNSEWQAVESLEYELYKKYQMTVHNDPPSKLSLSGFIRFLVKSPLKIRLIPTSIPNSEWQAVESLEYELYKKYQMTVHDDPPSKLSLSGFIRFLVKSPLKISLERMTTSSNSFPLSAELYKKYQMIIHNDTADECDEEQFYNFLVATPLQPQNFPNEIEGAGYGSFHQQYWLKDKLIAVGVIDILPRCVSSVYFFYDPVYRSLTLGTYGSVREVQLTRELHKSLPDLSSYYMGFYIHSCQKMRYKGKLVPSFLVCPETYSWIPIERCITLLEGKKYSRLNDDIDAIDTNVPTEEDILKMKIVYKFCLMRFNSYKTQVEGSDEKYREIGNLVGKECARRLIFWEE